METQPTKDVLKSLIEIEKSQKRLEKETSWLQISNELRHRSHSSAREAPAWRRSGGAAASFRIQDSRARVAGAEKFTDKQYLNILQSMGQSVHAFDLEFRIIFWNDMAEKLYGYSASEIVGQNPINVMVNDCDAAFAMSIAQRCVDNGESWSGEFPVKGKSGETFLAMITVSPFYDDDGSLIGMICITVNIWPFLNPRISARLKAQEGVTSSNPARKPGLNLNSRGAVISKLGLDSDQPIQVAIASKISSLASKVRSKMQAGDTSVPEQGFVSAARGDFISPFGVFEYDDEEILLQPSSEDESDGIGKSTICKVITSKAEEWIATKRLSWPWKGNEQEDSKGGMPTHSGDSVCNFRVNRWGGQFKFISF